jgi:membrane-associated protease RseP (regulator of RpoE activity)
MAESIDSFLKDYPGYQMVVLAGGGHLSFGSGIPKRSARRNGHDYAIILNDVEIEKDVAHYVLFPGTVPLESSPKLMVSLSEGKGQVTIQGFTPGSVSEKAGLQKGDILLSLDGIPVETVEDARLELLFKKKGDPVKVKILRKIPAEGDREMDFEVTPE